MNRYDLIVIGAGAGGLNIARFMNRIGLTVLLIEREEGRIGGDCLNFGCVPSKSLLHVARFIHSAQEAEGFGLSMQGSVSMPKVREYIESKKETIRAHENAEYLREEGIDVLIGEARFRGKRTVEVAANSYTAKKIVIATGSRPRKLNIEGSENADTVTNEEIFNLKSLPKKLLIIGGGPLGIEMAQAFRRLGSEVTVVQRGDTFLPKERQDISDVLLTRLKEEGVEFMFNAEPVRFERKHEVVISQGGQEQRISFDKALVSIGRQLDFSSLELWKAGIKQEGKRIAVDAYLRTTNPHIYVCGDVVGSYQFTHATELHASVIITNLLSPIKRKVSYETFSWVTFTDPEIATFGLDEGTLQQKNRRYQVLTYNFTDDDRAIVEGATEGRLVLFVDKGRILGGSMVGTNAGEISQELILAMSSGIDIKHIFGKIYAYPVATRVNKRIISNRFSERLTKRMKGVLRWFYG